MATVALAATCACLGYALASSADISIAGSIATMSGIIFFVIFFVGPRKGLLAHYLYTRAQQQELLYAIMCTYLSTTKAATPATMAHDLGWSPAYAATLLAQAHDRKLVILSPTAIALTSSGTAYIRS